MKTAPGDDWWERLYSEDDETPPTPAPEPADPGKPAERADEPDDQDPEEEEQATEDADTPRSPRPARWFVPDTGYYPPVPGPSQATTKVKSALSPGTRRALYNASAAGVGYWGGLAPALGDVIAACGRQASIGAALILGTGICLVIAHVWDRRTRHWWGILAWVARIPLASAITALALYAPASHP